METETISADRAAKATTVFQLGYASAATKPFGPDELKELLSKARTKNSSLNVTGMLLYHEGSFLQVLEGDKAVVETLYATIAEDPRHANAMLLFKNEATERSFDQWTMGFRQLVKDATDVPAGLNRFLENGMSGISNEDGEQIKEVLLGFREGRWHRTVDY